MAPGTYSKGPGRGPPVDDAVHLLRPAGAVGQQVLAELLQPRLLSPGGLPLAGRHESVTSTYTTRRLSITSTHTYIMFTSPAVA
jgi:hypothetical protein